VLVYINVVKAGFELWGLLLHKIDRLLVVTVYLWFVARVEAKL
jgi:hypothetical protein